MTPDQPKKVLGLFDIIAMTVVANLGLRWLAVAAGIGPISLVFWLLSALLFFFPLAVACSVMSKRYPEEGGIYAWAKNILGERSGFMVAWLYWANNFFYYPALLIFLASNFAYLLGDPGLTHDQTFITVSILVAFWIIVVISLLGLRFGKYVFNAGAIFGCILPAIILIILGFSALVVFKHSATSYHWHSFLPKGGLMVNLSALTIIMFAMSGIEVVPTFANSVKNANKTLYLGLLIAALSIFALYVLGTLAMSFVLNAEDIKNTTGLMQTFALVDAKFHMVWLTRVMAFFLTFAEFAAIVVWLLAPIVMFFKCTPRGVLPDVLHRVNRFDAPYIAVLLMGVLVTAIILLTTLLPNVNDMYQILVLMSTILEFIPYVYLAFMVLKARRNLLLPRYLTWAIGLCLLVSLVLGISFSLIPPAGMTGHASVQYEFELIGGPLLFILIGWAMYRFRRVVV